MWRVETIRLNPVSGPDIVDFIRRFNAACNRLSEIAWEKRLFRPVPLHREAYYLIRREFDLPLVFHGTPFQRSVWTALLDIPYGETASYGELARLLGKPAAARAVGLANGKNPVSIIVPCHRVIGSTGSLTGYGGGLDRKQYLLDFERRPSPREAASTSV